MIRTGQCPGMRSRVRCGMRERYLRGRPAPGRAPPRPVGLNAKVVCLGSLRRRLFTAGHRLGTAEVQRIGRCTVYVNSILCERRSLLRVACANESNGKRLKANRDSTLFRRSELGDVPTRSGVGGSANRGCPGRAPVDLRDLGLDPYRLVTLGEARQAAYDNRKLALAGGDPREMRAKRLIPTFRKAAAAVIEMHRPNWRNAKSVTSWESTLKSYAYPKIGSMPVDAIEPADVMRWLLPIWNTKRETARKVRQRIGTVMKWAIAEGHRKDNPAGDAIGAALPKVGHKTTHQRAIMHGEVAEALRKVRKCNALSSTKLAFEFLVLTACRSREVREAAWDEVDLDAGVWTVPGDRTKTGSEHRVPLSDRAMAVVEEARAFRENDLLFPTATGRTMSDSTLSKLLPRAWDRRSAARVPFDVPRLVRRDDQCTARGGRSGPRPQGGQRRGAGVCPLRPVREAPGADGVLGEVPRPRGRRRDRIAPYGMMGAAMTRATRAVVEWRRRRI